MLGTVDAPTSDAAQEIDHGNETVLVTFRGGTANFAKILMEWLNKHNVWHYEMVSGPDASNLFLVAVTQNTADAICKQLQISDPIDQPRGLYIAAIPQKGFRSKRFARGIDADKYDPTKQEMAQPGRKVGITPRLLAENGGW